VSPEDVPTMRDIDAREERLKERMDRGDKATGDRIDQIIIDRSEDREELRSFRRETRDDHATVIAEVKEVKAAVAPIPGLVAAVQSIADWRDKHNEHHGRNDVHIAERVAVTKERRRLLGIGFDVLKVLAGAGAGTALLKLLT